MTATQALALTQLDQQVECYTAQTFTLYTDGPAFFVQVSTENDLHGPFTAAHLAGGRFADAVGQHLASC